MTNLTMLSAPEDAVNAGPMWLPSRRTPRRSGSVPNQSRLGDTTDTTEDQAARLPPSSLTRP